MKNTLKRRDLFMRSTRKGKKTKRIPILSLSILIVILLVGAGFFIKEYLENDQEAGQADSTDEENQPNSTDSNSNDSEPEPEPDTFTDIRISAAGDIMFHDAQLKSAYD